MEIGKNTYVVIMAGGVGSRFWPASREAKPKQFLDILGVGKSLLRLTFERFLKLVPSERIYIVTNGSYQTLVKEHLPELTDSQILCEPSRNNTGPCVAYAAFKLHGLDPHANFVVAPSDHIILKEAEFLEHLQKALNFTASNDAIVTLGISPTRPDTGYGYIHFEQLAVEGLHRVIEFKEKPSLETAVNYISTGDYLWNAGIFVWSAKTILTAFENLCPEVYEILSAGKASYNTPQEQAFVNENYPRTKNISVDYAILEKSDNVFTIPANIGWSDLGTWASLHEEGTKDEHGNVVQAKAALLTNTTNCLVRAPKDKLIAIEGLQDYIVVDEEDALLIWPKQKEQEIKGLTKLVEEKWGRSFL